MEKIIKSNLTKEAQHIIDSARVIDGYKLWEKNGPEETCCEHILVCYNGHLYESVTESSVDTRPLPDGTYPENEGYYFTETSIYEWEKFKNMELSDLDKDVTTLDDCSPFLIFAREGYIEELALFLKGQELQQNVNFGNSPLVLEKKGYDELSEGRYLILFDKELFQCVVDKGVSCSRTSFREWERDREGDGCCHDLRVRTLDTVPALDNGSSLADEFGKFIEKDRTEAFCLDGFSTRDYVPGKSSNADDAIDTNKTFLLIRNGDSLYCGVKTNIATFDETWKESTNFAFKKVSQEEWDELRKSTASNYELNSEDGYIPVNTKHYFRNNIRLFSDKLLIHDDQMADAFLDFLNKEHEIEGVETAVER